MTRALVGALALATLLSCVPPRRAGVGVECEVNSECDAPLVCRLGHCRNECATSADCAAGLSCVLDSQHLGACQLPPETSCTAQSDCPVGLVCRFMQCTNDCETDRDCPGGARCEMDTDGLACIDRSGTPCTFDEECDPLATGERCLSGRCRRECFADRDCRNDFWCNGGRCHPPPRLDSGPLIDAGGLDVGGLDAAEDDAPGEGECTGGALGGVVSLSTGRSHACAVVDDAGTPRLFCWGNVPGIVGGSPCAAEVALGGSPALEIDAGGELTCVRDPAGGVACTGGLFGSTFMPVAPAGTADALAVGASHGCALLAGGAGVGCFGRGTFGALGTGSTADATTISMVTAVDTTMASAVGVGRTFSCAVTGMGDVACWGDDSYGQIGASGPALSGILEVDPGGEHTCARSATTLYCWGHNSAGQLAVATPMMRSSREAVPVPAGALRGIAAGNFHTCVDVDGDVYCWGQGTAIDGSAGNVLTPTLLLSDVRDVDAGDAYTCAIDAMDRVLCVGLNESSELGDGTTTPRYVAAPVQLR